MSTEKQLELSSAKKKLCILISDFKAGQESFVPLQGAFVNYITDLNYMAGNREHARQRNT